jgi:uncharacterized membrane protein (UPF0182 family)
VVQRRRRGALLPTVVVLAVLLILGLILSQLWTDALWYSQLGYLQVFRKQLVTRILLFLLGALIMAAGVAASLMIAYRSRPVYAPMSTEQAGLDRYRDSIEPLRRLVTIAVPAGLALFAGSAASQQWETVLLWLNRVPFGVDDPEFGLDIGFFVFTLPWLQFLNGFLTAVVFLSFLAGIVTHYLYGGLRLQGAGPRLTSAARIHLGSLAAAFLLLRAIDYWLGRYALSTRDSRLITGLTYTDANAVLTAKAVLSAIALIVAALFLVAVAADRWRLLPLYGVGLLVVAAIVVGGIYPAAVQRFQVRPNEQTLEAPFIERNIEATRTAYGLSEIKVTPYSAKSEAAPAALREDAETVPGIRLLDPALVSDSFRQLQQIKPYYSFSDSLDVDRYKIGNETRDTVIAVREVDLDAAPPNSRNWVNDHTFYTHGFGVVAARGNQRGPDGRPVFYQQGIPSTGDLGEYQPRVYFGERSPSYSIVGAPDGARPQELDFPDDDSENLQQNTTYKGEGGVRIGSTLRRLLYAIKFRDQNILLSSAVNSESQILYDRNPRQRVQKVAPFLTLDGDPYPAVVDGRIRWIIDGYTTTSHYPYSRTQVLEDATADSLTATRSSVVALPGQRVNYMRNSVKATVDAYDGKVTLYAWDEEDPLLRAWRQVFPGAVKPLSQIDGELMSHMRYPEDLFKVQRDLMQQYHVTDASAFFGQQDFWRVPNDPTQTSSDRFQPPYYLTLQMPDQDAPTFSLSSTFIPAGGTREVLTGFLAVDADAGNQAGQRRPGYGQLRLLQLPRDSVVPGPGLVQNNFNADPTVSESLNLLRGARSGTGQSGSVVESGNLLTLPFADGLLYVQPVYVRGSSGNTYPLLQRVLVAFGDKIGFANTLDDALDQVFGGSGLPTPPGGEGAPPPSTDPPAGDNTALAAAQQRLQTALNTAAGALRESDAALKAGDFTRYGAAQRQLQDAVNDAIAAQRAIAAAQPRPSATPSPSASPGATASPSPSPSPSP